MKLSNKDIKIMVFNQYRDNASNIVSILNTIPGVSAKLFVGQQKKGESGLSQKNQKIMLDEFRESVFNVLVATSVGEEGLDIPKVDLVIFFEPIPSAIRSIQRRGRTGRLDEGRVIILLTKNTRDEGYRWSAFHKEKKMHKNLESLRNKVILKENKESLKEYVKEKEEDKVKIFADHREKGSGVIKELFDLNVELKLEQLNNADYIVSSRCGIEFKTVEDFANSIIDGRLLEQIKQLKHNFERPLVMVEGEEDLFSVRNIHPNAIRGMMATIAVSYGIPVLFTRNPKESAEMLKIIAKREQDETGSYFSMHTNKRQPTTKEQQEYIVSSLPNVGMSLAKELLSKFNSVRKVMTASEEQLKKVEKIGDIKSKKIREVLDTEYNSE